MKKLFIYVVLMVISFSAISQDELESKNTLSDKKGKFIPILGLGLDCSIQRSSIVFNPKLAYYLTEKIEVGVESKFNYSYQFASAYSGLYAKYYFIKKRFSPFVQIGHGANFQKYRLYNLYTPDQTYYSFNNHAHAGLGFKYQINKNLGLEAKYFLNHQLGTKYIDGNINLQFNINF